MDNNKKTIVRKFSGVVLPSKMEKTIVVSVENVRINKKYGKRFSLFTKFKVHDEKNKFKEGDKVEFVECRPLSHDKRWRVLYK